MINASITGLMFVQFSEDIPITRRISASEDCNTILGKTSCIHCQLKGQARLFQTKFIHYIIHYLLVTSLYNIKFKLLTKSLIWILQSHNIKDLNIIGRRKLVRK